MGLISRVSSRTYRIFKMDNPQDKARRSVFVGNIPYEATEETLYGIFGEVGPVKGLRLVTDKETGKPKGYGFIEYNDPATAQSAIRNLAGREIHGRNLRVDSASKTQQGGGNQNFGGNYNNSNYNQDQGYNNNNQNYQQDRGPTSFDQFGQNQQQQQNFNMRNVKQEAPPVINQPAPSRNNNFPPQQQQPDLTQNLKLLLKTKENTATQLYQ